MEIIRSALLPNLLTVGNGICGFAALTQLAAVEVASGGGFVNPQNFTVAATLILLGMVFDIFDGKVARLSKSGATELGAQLDSLCDLVTFGLAPAYLIVCLNSGAAVSAPQAGSWQKVVWFFSLAYFLGAMLRLARFNVENAPDESAHLCFKGLPTPAAAGCVASLVLFQRYILKFEANELQFLSRFVEPERLKEAVAFITPALGVLGIVLGFTMVSSRLKFEHVGSKLFQRPHSIDFFVYLIFGVLLLAMLPEIVLPLAFVGYLVWTPLKTAYYHFFPQRQPVVSDESP
jgi:CDP-diacylglycerol--serine O-phosphatidyltransferase